MLRELGPQKWVFDECVKINEMRFRFKEKEKPENLVTHVVTCMQVLKMETMKLEHDLLAGSCAE